MPALHAAARAKIQRASRDTQPPLALCCAGFRPPRAVATGLWRALRPVSLAGASCAAFLCAASLFGCLLLPVQPPHKRCGG